MHLNDSDVNASDQIFPLQIYLYLFYILNAWSCFLYFYILNFQDTVNVRKKLQLLNKRMWYHQE